MALQFIMGPPGQGKSHYLYEKVTKASLEHPETNYIAVSYTHLDVYKRQELDYYYANQLPEDKVKRLEEFLDMQDDTECLAAVGDGINDAPVPVSYTHLDENLAYAAQWQQSALSRSLLKSPASTR